MRVVIVFIILLIASQSFAQSDCTRHIKGKILDKETRVPLSFATVKILNSDVGTISDDKGLFTLDDICELEVDFEIRFLGYKTVVHHHDFYNDDHVERGHIIYLSPEKNLLESVVIEGDITVGDMQSMTLDRIGRSELATKTTQSLASAIGSVQGVSFISTGANVQLPVIHGLYGNRILIINNGVKHGFQNWGTDHAPEIDITNADNISVIKGAAGVRYGPEALGGVVVVEGNPLKLSQKMYGGITSGFQTNGRGYNTNAYFGAGNDRLSYHLGGSYKRIGDQNAPDYELTNSGIQETSMNAGIRYHLPQWNFKLRYNYVNQDLALLRSSVADSGDLFARALSSDEPLFIRDFSYDINEPKQATNHHLATLSVDWHSHLGKLTLLLSQQINQRQGFDVRRNANLPIIDLQLNTTDARLEWVHHPSKKGLEGIIGLQYFSQNNDNKPGTNTTPFIPNYNTHRLGAYVIESFEKGDNTFELGMRLDHEFNSVRGRETNQDIFRNEFSFTNVTASLGMVRNLSSKWKMRTNLGSAWRRPNMAELYSFGQHGFKVNYGLWRHYFDEGDPRTDRVLTEDDEVAEAEQGIKWMNEFSRQGNGNSLTITGYSNFIKNFTYDRPLAVIGTFRGPMPAFIYEQSDALFFGADLTYSRKFATNIKGTFGGSYLWSRNVEDNEALINQPPININANLSWDAPSVFGLDYSIFTFETSYTFQQFQSPRTVTPEQLINGEVEIDANSEIFDFKNAPDGYFMANILWKWKYGKLGGQVEVRNLLNTSYRDYLNQMRYFADEPGRNFLFTINYKF